MPTLTPDIPEPVDAMKAALAPDRLTPDPELLEQFRKAVDFSQYGVKYVDNTVSAVPGATIITQIPVVPIIMCMDRIGNVLPPSSISALPNLWDRDAYTYWNCFRKGVLSLAAQRIKAERRNNFEQRKEALAREIRKDEVDREVPQANRKNDWEVDKVARDTADNNEVCSLYKTLTGQELSGQNRSSGAILDFHSYRQNNTHGEEMNIYFNLVACPGEDRAAAAQQVALVQKGFQDLVVKAVREILSDPKQLEILQSATELGHQLDVKVAMKDVIAQAQWMRDQVETPEQREHFLEVANAIVRYLESDGDEDLADLDVEALSVEEAINRHCIGLYVAKAADGRSKYKATRFHAGAIQPVEWDEFLVTMSHELAHHKQRKVDGALHDDAHDVNQSLLANQYLQKMRTIHFEPDGSIDASKVRAFLTVEQLEDMYKRLGAVEGARAVSAEANGRAAALAGVPAPPLAAGTPAQVLPDLAPAPPRAALMRTPRPSVAVTKAAALWKGFLKLMS